MLNESQVRFLRASVQMNQDWNNCNESNGAEDLANSMSAFGEDHDVRLNHHVVTYRYGGPSRGVFSVSAEDLARIGEMHPSFLPEV